MTTPRVNKPHSHCSCHLPTFPKPQSLFMPPPYASVQFVQPVSTVLQMFCLQEYPCAPGTVNRCICVEISVHHLKIFTDADLFKPHFFPQPESPQVQQSASSAAATSVFQVTAQYLSFSVKCNDLLKWQICLSQTRHLHLIFQAVKYSCKFYK